MSVQVQEALLAFFFSWDPDC